MIIHSGFAPPSDPDPEPEAILIWEQGASLDAAEEED